MSELQIALMQAPRPDVRLVHVAVRAEGPTRILCFSDSKGTSLAGDEEDTLTDATAKLGALQKRLQVCTSVADVISSRHMETAVRISDARSLCVLCLACSRQGASTELGPSFAPLRQAFRFEHGSRVLPLK